jgi:hypothetical protein
LAQQEVYLDSYRQQLRSVERAPNVLRLLNRWDAGNLSEAERRVFAQLLHDDPLPREEATRSPVARAFNRLQRASMARDFYRAQQPPPHLRERFRQIVVLRTEEHLRFMLEREIRSFHETGVPLSEREDLRRVDMSTPEMREANREVERHRAEQRRRIRTERIGVRPHAAPATARGSMPASAAAPEWEGLNAPSSPATAAPLPAAHPAHSPVLDRPSWSVLEQEVYLSSYDQRLGDIENDHIVQSWMDDWDRGELTEVQRRFVRQLLLADKLPDEYGTRSAIVEGFQRVQRGAMARAFARSRRPPPELRERFRQLVVQRTEEVLRLMRQEEARSFRETGLPLTEREDLRRVDLTTPEMVQAQTVLEEKRIAARREKQQDMRAAGGVSPQEMMPAAPPLSLTSRRLLDSIPASAPTHSTGSALAQSRVASTATPTPVRNGRRR